MKTVIDIPKANACKRKATIAKTETIFNISHNKRNHQSITGDSLLPLPLPLVVNVIPPRYSYFMGWPFWLLLLFKTHNRVYSSDPLFWQKCRFVCYMYINLTAVRCNIGSQATNQQLSDVTFRYTMYIVSSLENSMSRNIICGRNRVLFFLHFSGNIIHHSTGMYFISIKNIVRKAVYITLPARRKAYLLCTATRPTRPQTQYRKLS